MAKGNPDAHMNMHFMGSRKCLLRACSVRHAIPPARLLPTQRAHPHSSWRASAVCVCEPSSVTSGVYSSGRLSLNTGHLQQQGVVRTAASHMVSGTGCEPWQVNRVCAANTAMLSQRRWCPPYSSPCPVCPGSIQVEGVRHKALHRWWCGVHVAVLQLLRLHTNLQQQQQQPQHIAFAHCTNPFQLL